MYEPYPGGGQEPEPGRRAPVPSSVSYAVKVMYAGAAVSLISLILGLTTIGSVRTAVRHANPSYTPSQVNSSVDMAVAFAIVGGVLGIGLWLWIAQMCKAGKNWARITGTVFFGLDTLFLLIGFTAAGDIGSRLLGIVIWLIGLAAVVLLWQRDSTAFFKPGGPYPGG